MKILMIANFVTFPFEGGNSRFTYILDRLECTKNDIELITSNFRHATKKKRSIDIKNETNYKITLIDEPPYRKNVSIKRFISHKLLSKNIGKYLKTLDYKPDVVYCSIPSIDVAYVALNYAKKNNIRFILDIQDLWPESFKMALNVPIISDLIFWPMKIKVNYIYSNADEIVAVSETYVERAMSLNKKVKEGMSVFLGTDLQYFDECAAKNKVNNNDELIKIGYIGTLGTSYNIKLIIDAIKELNDRGINNIKFIVMGDGPLKDKFMEYATIQEINCEFTGRLEYEEMVGLLCSCDIAVNPIIDSSVASIINKVGDYAAAGLPVINTQRNLEYRNLVNEYNIGFNCENDDVSNVAKSIEKLVNDESLRKKLGRNNRKLAEEKFDRNVTYENISKLIKGVE